MFRYILTLVGIVIFLSCGNDIVYTPKPRGFPKVIYPEKLYQTFSEDYCSFKFDFPVYAEVEQDEDFFDDKALNPCWFDLNIDQFDAKVHCSYIPIGTNNSLDKLKNDAFMLANKHNIKANYIDELPIEKGSELKGFLFSIEGPVATPLQFYLTDEKEHFLRGSLYFKTQARPDSLAPIVDFVRNDILHMINTFEWN